MRIGGQTIIRWLVPWIPALLVINFVLFFSQSNLSETQTTKCQQKPRREGLSTIYVITPTYARAVQKAELTRLAHTLLLVPQVHWILVEDSDSKTSLVENFLAALATRTEQFGASVYFTHLNIPTPPEFRTKQRDPNWLKPRGVLQRNAGISWLRDNWESIDRHGVVYFADDDNVYDIQLFEEIRRTKGVSVFPVALVGGLMVERPVVGPTGKVQDFNSVWDRKRPYPIDMAGFAVNVQLLLSHPEAQFSLAVPRGHQESHLLKQLIGGWQDLEPLTDNCTKVLVWHTRTQLPKLDREKYLSVPSNHGIEV